LQRVNVKFCAKLGNIASDICAMLSGANGESYEKSSVSEWYKRFKEGLNFEITNEEIAQHFLRYQGCCTF